jgi:Pyruvate kinase, barrel domain
LLLPLARSDLEFALTLSIDWVALSFVQKPEDIVELRGLAGPKVKLMAKLEKPSAIDYLDEVRNYVQLNQPMFQQLDAVIHFTLVRMVCIFTTDR